MWHPEWTQFLLTALVIVAVIWVLVSLGTMVYILIRNVKKPKVIGAVK